MTIRRNVTSLSPCGDRLKHWSMYRVKGTKTQGDGENRDKKVQFKKPSQRCCLKNLAIQWFLPQQRSSHFVYHANPIFFPRKEKKKAAAEKVLTHIQTQKFEKVRDTLGKGDSTNFILFSL